jgi:hypothetical protein
MTDEFKKHLVELIDDALDKAYEAGCEFVADSEGCQWGELGLEKADLAAGDARQKLMDALGVEE